jgi:photosystem II stability/assembly factor-like uncharacterized protein
MKGYSRFLAFVGLTTVFSEVRDAGDSRIADDHGAHAAWERAQLRDEKGRIPDNALAKAFAQKRAMPFRPQAWSEFSHNLSTERPIWTWKGPGNIGGRTLSIVIHPINPSIMWLGGVSGGIWKTTNGGESWHTNTDFLPSLDISCLAIDPRDPDVLYAGTDYPDAIGIYKTTDGGKKWALLSSTPQRVHRIAVSPTDSKILLAATYDGIYRSPDAGQSWNKTDSGCVFEQVVFHPTDGMKALASGYCTAQYSSDGGLTWTDSAGLPLPGGRVELAYARSDPSVVYASVDSDGGRPIYRSNDGGQSFAATGGDTGDNGYYGFATALWVDPTNSNNLVVGGVNLYRSTDRGKTFTLIGNGGGLNYTPRSLHEDQHTVLSPPGFDGSTNKTVFIGNDGGIFRTDDIYASPGFDPHTGFVTLGWVKLAHHLGITQFYGGAGNSSTGSLIGGNQDNGVVLSNQSGTEHWVPSVGGDGGFCAADQTDPNTFYGEAQYRYIFRISWNKGASDIFLISGGIIDRSLYIAPFILDPNNQNTMLAGGAQLWRTLMAKSSPVPPAWSSIKAALPTGALVSAIAIAQGDSDIIWVGYDDGSLYYTTNGTQSNPTWVQANLGSPNLPARYCERIAINPQKSSQVYVTFGGYSSDNVWKTVDYGANWTDISNGLPSAPVRSLAISPSNSKALYIGTDVGIFATADEGSTWSSDNEGLANVQVNELFWVGKRLVAATYGRGMFATRIKDDDP